MSETPQLSAAIVNGISSSTCVLVFSTTCHVPISCLASQMAVDACALTTHRATASTSEPPLKLRTNGWTAAASRGARVRVVRVGLRAAAPLHVCTWRSSV